MAFSADAPNDAAHAAACSRSQENRRFPSSAQLTVRRCDCNLQNRRTVSRILAGIMQHAPGSRSNILPGSAPALRSVILYPFSPLPLPLRTTPSPSPRTLARNPHPAQDASAFAPKLARAPPFSTHSEPKQMAHAGAGFPSRRPVPGGRDGVWDTGRGHQPMGIKRGPWMAPRPLKNTM